MSLKVELELHIHMRGTRSIRVSKDGVYREDERLNPFLPTSEIEILREPVRLGPARIRMPRWLAERKGLL